MGDAGERVLVASMPLCGGPVECVSWGRFRGRLCWSGFTTRTTPMTFIVEDFRIDASRKLESAKGVARG
jgi:hypothetical protein